MELHGTISGSRRLAGAMVPRGVDGRGIVSVEKTATAGLVDTYTITYTDGSTSTFAVTNGANGAPGNGDLIASDFSASSDYTAGDYVLYSGSLYRFTAAHTAGAWTGADAEEVQLADVVAAVGGDIGDLGDLHTEAKSNLVAAINEITPPVVYKVRDISGDPYAKYGGVFEQGATSDLFNLGFSYNPTFSIDVKAGQLYLLAYLSSNGSSRRTEAFYYNRINTSDIAAVEIDDNGDLIGLVSDFSPTYPVWQFNPNNTSSGIWNTETFDQWGNRVYSSLPFELEGTTYYWKGLAFVPNRDFHGVVQLVRDNMLQDNDYLMLFEINDEEWNPYVDGGLEKGYSLKETHTIPAEEKAAIIAEANDSYAQKFNCLFGKRWACLGDSLTQYSGGTGEVDNPDDLGFMTQIMRRTGVLGTKLALAGAKWSSSTDGSFDSGSAVERVHTIVNGTDDFDIITFAFGTNTDADGEGTASDAPAYDGTMCAAIKWCIEALVAWKPTVAIGIVLPPQRADMGTSGNTLMKTRGALIREVAAQYSVPCCDMWAESGINTMHYTNPATGNEKYYYLSDMLHLSDNGRDMYGKRLRAFLDDIVPIY